MDKKKDVVYYFLIKWYIQCNFCILLTCWNYCEYSEYFVSRIGISEDKRISKIGREAFIILYQWIIGHPVRLIFFPKHPFLNLGIVILQVGKFSIFTQFQLRNQGEKWKEFAKFNPTTSILT